jgi:hypothetical protein
MELFPLEERSLLIEVAGGEIKRRIAEDEDRM